MRAVEDIFLILAIVFQLIAVGCLCYTAITNNVRLNKLATLFAVATVAVATLPETYKLTPDLVV